MTAAVGRPLSPVRRARLNRRSLHLAYATAGYNLAEGAVALAAGAVASSTALVELVLATHGGPTDRAALERALA